MEIVRNGCCAIKSFISAVIEWRSTATAPYLMFINSAFWWSVFYLDKGTQLRLLVSFAAGVFGWDILLSSTYDRSILFHILAWPVRSVIRTASVVMALYSAQFLYWTELEKACWTAYSAVALFMINPVWLYYQVPRKIDECLHKVLVTTKYVAQITVISPLFSFYRILEYIVMLRWLTVAVRNGIVCAVITTRGGIVYTITSTKSGIVFIITFSKNGILSGYLSFKNGLIGGILQLNNCLTSGLCRSKDAFYYSIIIAEKYIRYALVAVQHLILNFFLALVRWIKTKIVKPVRNAFHAVIQFLQYWLCAHWWPNLRSWFLLHVIFRLQLLFNCFCFGILYVSCGYWISPFIAFLSKYFRRFYAYFRQSVLNPVEIWIRGQIEKALIYLKQLLHNLAIRVRDSIIWPFFVLLISLMKKVCFHLYRILLQPIIDALYEKYKVCEDYLLIYYLGPVCQLFVDHIPKKSAFCDDTDTELADLLPTDFNDESDIEEVYGKPSLSSRSLSPFTEDERDFFRGLKFPNLDTSDSSGAEFELRPKSKFQKLLKRKPKAHPKDPAHSAFSDELISTTYKVKKNKDKRKRLSSTSSNSESAVSSSAQIASDADLQNSDAFDFESMDRPQAEFLGGNVEIQKAEDSRNGRSERKQNIDQKKVEEIEVCDTGQVNVTTGGLDDSFEMLDK